MTLFNPSTGDLTTHTRTSADVTRHKHLCIPQLSCEAYVGKTPGRYEKYVVRGTSEDSCYYYPLPDLPISPDTRTIPWGEPTITYPNGTTCCSSLDQVRSELDAINSQLLQLLSTRSAYVREATRFKATEESVNDPSRNQEVIQGAIDAAPSVYLPQVVAKMVFEGIINSSVLFEECIFNAYDDDSC